MADRYKPYKAGQFSLTGLRSVDDSAGREAVRMSNTLANTASKISNFAFQEFSKQMERKAKQDASTNTQEILDKYKDKQVSLYDRTAFDTAVAISSSRVETDARQLISNKLLEAETNNVNPVAFAQELDGIVNGSTQGVKKYSPLEAVKLEETLKRLSTNAYTNYQKTFTKLEQEKLQAKAIEGSNARQVDMESIARSEMSPEEKKIALDTELTNYKQFLEINNFTPVAVAKEIKQLQTKLYTERVRGDFSRAKNKIEFLQKFNSDINRTGVASGLDGATFKMLSSEMSSKINSINKVHKSTLKSLETTFKDLKDVTDGGYDNNEQLENLLLEVQAVPGSETLQQEIIVALKNHNIYQSFSKLSIGGMRRELEALRNSFTTDGSEPTPGEVEILDNIEKILSNTVTDSPLPGQVKEDLDFLRTIIKNPNLRLNKEKLKEIKKNIETLDDKNVTSDFVQLWNKIDMLEKSANGPVSQIRDLKEEVNVINKEQGISTDDEVQFVKSLSTLLKNKETKIKNDFVNYAIEQNPDDIPSYTFKDGLLIHDNKILDAKTFEKRAIQLEAIAEEDDEIDSSQVEYFSKENMESFKSAYENSTQPEKRLQILSHISNIAGHRSDEVFGQINKNGQFHMARLGMLINIGKEDLVRRVIRGQLLAEGDFKNNITEGLKQEINQEILNNLSGLSNTLPQHILATTSALVTPLLLEKVQSGTSVDDILEHIPDAIQDLLGADGDKGGAVEYEIRNATHTILIPDTIKRDELENILENVTLEMLEFASVDPDGNENYQPPAYIKNGKSIDYKEKEIGGLYFDNAHSPEIFQVSQQHPNSADPEDVVQGFSDKFNLPQKYYIDINRLKEAYYESLEVENKPGTRFSRLAGSGRLQEIMFGEKPNYKQRKEQRMIKSMTTNKAKGKEVANLTVDTIVDIMPGSNPKATKSMLLGMMMVESNMGTHRETFRTSYSTGLLQFDKDGGHYADLMGRIKKGTDTQLMANVEKIQTQLKEKLNIDMDIKNFTYEDMNKPLPAVILARLFLALDKNAIPTTLEGQAYYWKFKWNTLAGAGSIDDYISKNEWLGLEAKMSDQEKNDMNSFVMKVNTDDAYNKGAI
ncbi:hypothetical protein [Polaribacter sp.]|uniref:hypothetical protein n=1 Tax=Polaribacter sp. TaxID=1920175 RepID=UPI0025EED348|nr:hypothetical protein [Polaribacter sp.]